MTNLQFYLKRMSLFMTDGKDEFQLLDFSENYCSNTSLYYNQGFNKILQSYDLIPQNVLANVSKLDTFATVCCLFEYLLKNPLKKVNILEIGNCFDITSYFAAKTLELFSPDDHLYCCNICSESENDLDVWKHSNQLSELALYEGILRCLSGFKNISTFKADLQYDTDILKDDYFDIIILSGSLGYQDFIKNLIYSIRIIKPDGILIGYNSDFYDSKQFVNLNFNSQFYGADESAVKFILNRLSNSSNRESIPYATVWSRKITVDDKYEIQQRFCNDKKSKIGDKFTGFVDKLEENLESIENDENTTFADYNKKLFDNGTILMSIEKLLSSCNGEDKLRKIKLLTVQVNECNLDLICACEKNKKSTAKELLQRETNLIQILKDKTIRNLI